MSDADGVNSCGSPPDWVYSDITDAVGPATAEATAPQTFVDATTRGLPSVCCVPLHPAATTATTTALAATAVDHRLFIIHPPHPQMTIVSEWSVGDGMHRTHIVTC
ncbi:hypothetical protein GCM10009624_00450 [Gordonia sinesedis]